jgi:hypothetical protein
VGSSTGTELQSQPVKIADLFSKCSDLADQEEKGMGRIVSTILPVLAWLNEPVVLRPGSLGGPFLEFRSVTLETGAIVVMTDPGGRVASRQLSEFRTAECLAILNESFPELQRMTANKRRAGEVKPLLSLKLALGGSHLIVDMRSYRLSVSNSGGDCVGLRVSALLPGGRSKPTRPCDVGRGKKAEFDLGVLKEVAGLERLELQIDCRDVDGRELRAEEFLPLGGADWQEVQLRRKN